MKSIYYFFVKSGEILFVWAILVILSITMLSIRVKGKVDYGNRCYQSFNDEFIKDYKYEGIEMKDGYLECNTYYLMYHSNLDEKENLRFLISVSKLLSDNNININIHAMIKCEDYQILSTIVDYKVSYVTSRI